MQANSYIYSKLLRSYSLQPFIRMAFHFHLYIEYLAITVFFLYPMRMLDPKAMKALWCPNTGYAKTLCTSCFRAGWYGAKAGDIEVIRGNGLKAIGVPRCWVASGVALHLWELSTWPRVHDHGIMYNYAESSWEMWPNRSQEEVRLSQKESFILHVTKAKAPNIDPSST